ncbi:MAG: hypothetical protein EZS28_044365, partial [Streblomastix strix]
MSVRVPQRLNKAYADSPYIEYEPGGIHFNGFPPYNGGNLSGKRERTRAAGITSYELEWIEARQTRSAKSGSGSGT